MIKKGTIAFILLTLLAFISGCGMIKGAFIGATYGAKKDWQALQKANDWLRENLW